MLKRKRNQVRLVILVLLLTVVCFSHSIFAEESPTSSAEAAATTDSNGSKISSKSTLKITDTPYWNNDAFYGTAMFTTVLTASTENGSPYEINYMNLFYSDVKDSYKFGMRSGDEIGIKITGPNIAVAEDEQVTSSWNDENQRIGIKKSDSNSIELARQLTFQLTTAGADGGPIRLMAGESVTIEVTVGIRQMGTTTGYFSLGSTENITDSDEISVLIDEAQASDEVNYQIVDTDENIIANGGTPGATTEKMASLGWAFKDNEKWSGQQDTKTLSKSPLVTQLTYSGTPKTLSIPFGWQYASETGEVLQAELHRDTSEGLLASEAITLPTKKTDEYQLTTITLNRDQLVGGANTFKLVVHKPNSTTVLGLLSITITLPETRDTATTLSWDKEAQISDKTLENQATATAVQVPLYLKDPDAYNTIQVKVMNSTQQVVATQVVTVAGDDAENEVLISIPKDYLKESRNVFTVTANATNVKDSAASNELTLTIPVTPRDVHLQWQEGSTTEKSVAISTADQFQDIPYVWQAEGDLTGLTFVVTAEDGTVISQASNVNNTANETSSGQSEPKERWFVLPAEALAVGQQTFTITAQVNGVDIGNSLTVTVKVSGELVIDTSQLTKPLTWQENVQDTGTGQIFSRKSGELNVSIADTRVNQTDFSMTVSAQLDQADAPFQFVRKDKQGEVTALRDGPVVIFQSASTQLSSESTANEEKYELNYDLEHGILVQSTALAQAKQYSGTVTFTFVNGPN